MNIENVTGAGYLTTIFTENKTLFQAVRKDFLQQHPDTVVCDYNTSGFALAFKIKPTTKYILMNYPFHLPTKDEKRKYIYEVLRVAKRNAVPLICVLNSLNDPIYTNMVYMSDYVLTLKHETMDSFFKLQNIKNRNSSVYELSRIIPELRVFDNV